MAVVDVVAGALAQRAGVDAALLDQLQTIDVAAGDGRTLHLIEHLHVAGGRAIVEYVAGCDAGDRLEEAVAVAIVLDARAALLNQVILEVCSASLRTGSDAGGTSGGPETSTPAPLNTTRDAAPSLTVALRSR